MGYLNNVTGYREDLLANRAIVKHGNFALLTPDGLVKNIIPGFEKQPRRRDLSHTTRLIIFSYVGFCHGLFRGFFCSQFR